MKNKYKRSAWFEGLLEAEDVMKKGYVPDKCKLQSSIMHTEYFWFCGGEYGGSLGINIKDTGKLSGVCDYLDHIGHPFPGKNKESYWYY